MSRHITADRVREGWIFRWATRANTYVIVQTIARGYGFPIIFHCFRICIDGSPSGSLLDNGYLRSIDHFRNKDRYVPRKERLKVHRYLQQHSKELSS